MTGGETAGSAGGGGVGCAVDFRASSCMGLAPVLGSGSADVFLAPRRAVWFTAPGIGSGATLGAAWRRFCFLGNRRTMDAHGSGPHPRTGGRCRSRPAALHPPYMGETAGPRSRKAPRRKCLFCSELRLEPTVGFEPTTC